MDPAPPGREGEPWGRKRGWDLVHLPTEHDLIRVGFSTSKGLVSWAIRKLTRSEVSHCFFIADFWGVSCALEATDRGFVATPLEAFTREAGRQFVTVCDLEMEDAPTLRHVASMLGHPYDFAGLAGFLWVLLGRRLGRSWRNPIRSESRVFCSEAIVRVLQASRYPGADLLDPERVSPQDLLVFLRS